MLLEPWVIVVKNGSEAEYQLFEFPTILPNYKYLKRAKKIILALVKLYLILS